MGTRENATAQTKTCARKNNLLSQNTLQAIDRLSSVEIE